MNREYNSEMQTALRQLQSIFLEAEEFNNKTNYFVIKLH